MNTFDIIDLFKSLMNGKGHICVGHSFDPEKLTVDLWEIELDPTDLERQIQQQMWPIEVTFNYHKEAYKALAS